MAKKEFNSFQEELEHDYHVEKKIKKIKARLKLGMLIAWLILVIIGVVACSSAVKDFGNAMSTVDTVGQ